MEPNTSVENIKSLGNDVKVMKTDGKTEVKEGSIGTGYKIKVGDKTYTAVKLGDISGDGKLSSSDLLKIKKHLLKATTLKDEYFKAADINQDGEISSSDLLKIKKYLMQTTRIEISK